MSAVWTLVKKELRVLLRDRIATVLLLGMPLVFILVLGLLLGEGFGQQPDDRLRVSLVSFDQGPGLEGETWASVVQRDLADTGGIKVEVIPSMEVAQDLVRQHKRAAVLVFRPTFSEQIDKCSFLSEGINPFFRDGVYLDKVDAELLKDPKQPGAAAIIEQVAQVSLMRVILPWMIGRAFDKLSDPDFLSILAREARIPRFLLTEEFKKQMGIGIKASLKMLFSKYNLTGKTWAALTKSSQGDGPRGTVSEYENRGGSGLFSRGAQRYQVLVPSYTVMFSFFLVLVVGGVFVSERRQGTLKRLRAAPLRHGQILLGKLLPCFMVSVAQGVFLLVAGRLLFGLRWGPQNWPLWLQAAWLLPVVLATALAAMGLALLVAAVAKTEIQVAIFGAVPVLVLSLIGGCVLPREMMPEQTQALALVTPQGWALEAYRELFDASAQYLPNTGVVLRACGVLTAFGASFLAVAWGLLRLD
jgi:ABC-type Na+ efflux pump permease subunit